MIRNVSIDKFLGKMPSKTYNCLDVAREVWLHICGEDITARFPSPISGKHLSLEALRTIRFEQLREPVSPCFVLMRRFRLSPHIGVYLDGRIIHLTSYGVQFQLPELATMFSSSVRYYR
jgi:hypothetical protein